MFGTGEGELTDEGAHLLQKALYVEPLHYPMDFKKFPTNGHEYIHQVRLEEASIFPEVFQENSESLPVCCPEEVAVPKMSPISLQQWKRKEANSFSYLAGELKTYKEQLKKNFPPKSVPPIGNEKGWCLFSLGSDLYAKIYVEEKPQDTDGNFPYLSIVLYLSQKDVVILLEYMKNWLNVIGMDHSLCRWIYSLLACVVKPLNDECEMFLEDLCDDVVQKSKVCDESEKNQFHLISAILKNYFCIKAYQIGPDLDKFLKLC